MMYPPVSDRRAFLKWIGALPLLGYVAGQGLVEKAQAAIGKGALNNLYTRIGVRPFINARGTWTYLSGSLELPEVKAAKEQAARYFVDIFELQRAVGKRLAELSGASVLLIEALGGGWNASTLPTSQDVVHGN